MDSDAIARESPHGGRGRAVIQVHVYVEVTDAAAGAAFYTDAFGLAIRRRITARWIELGRGPDPPPRRSPASVHGRSCDPAT